MKTDGNVASPIRHTRAVPLPVGPVVYRPVERRNTSPFAGMDPSQPSAVDPDAVARIGSRGPRKARPVSWDVAACVQEYADGATLRDLAAKYRRSMETIRFHLTDRGVEIRARGVRPGSGRKITPDDPIQKRILELHAAGLTNRAIAAEVGMKDTSVAGRLAAAGIQGPGRGKKPTFDPQLAWSMVHEQGISRVETARRLGVSPRAIGKQLDRIDRQKAEEAAQAQVTAA